MLSAAIGILQLCRGDHFCFVLAAYFMSLAALKWIRVQELCESLGGHPGLSILMSHMVPVDVKQH